MYGLGQVRSCVWSAHVISGMAGSSYVSHTFQGIDRYVCEVTLASMLSSNGVN